MPSAGALLLDKRLERIESKLDQICTKLDQKADVSELMRLREKVDELGLNMASKDALQRYNRWIGRILFTAIGGFVMNAVWLIFKR